MTETTPTRLWNDSADIDELKYSIENGAVGATCNPVIAVTILKKHIAEWRPRIEALLGEMPAATEDQVGWKLVEEVSIKAAKLLEPAFAAHGGRDGRLSIQTDPRLYRDAAAIVENAMAFSRLAQNMIVKIPATRAGIVAIEEVTYRGSASTRPCRSPCRSASRWRRRSSAGSAAARQKARTSSRWARSARSWSAGSTIGSRCCWTSARSASTPATSSGRAWPSSRRRTGYSASAGTACDCCPRLSATTCTGASWSAPTL